MTVNATITGLRFFFEVTLRRVDALEQMSPVHEPRTLPVVLSVMEVEQIIAAAGSLTPDRRGSAVGPAPQH